MSTNTYQIKITAKTVEDFEAIKKKVDSIHLELVKRFDRVEQGAIGLEFETNQYMTHDHMNFPSNFHIKRVGFKVVEGEWGGSNRTMYQVETYGTFKPEDEAERSFDARFIFICLEPSFEVKSF